ncbi:uncharacterized protein C2845_PM17G09490 [Panicum miliaceum]|uniref:Ubiquitin-like protease family profile domain-containing protein n=1 Tax=Panicum miliaceum TaxID=4540 RepID=A0A3L6Q2B2_PANMI|nr:uncharacterized protein C2845_PM17G09490 [Panicum miliaceum]
MWVNHIFFHSRRLPSVNPAKAMCHLQKEKVMSQPKVVITPGSCVPDMMTDELEPCGRLRAILTTPDSPLESVPVMNYGGGLAYGKDIMKSFRDGLELDDMFVDFANECIIHDDIHIYSLSEGSCVFIGTFAMRLLNAEHLMHLDQAAPPFESDPLVDVLNTMLPLTEAMKNTQLICLPLLHHNHWVLYVVNRVTQLVHIMDSNLYDTEMGGTTWKDFHHQTVSICGKSFTLNKLIINRLTTTLHRARRKCGFPKFGNWSYKFEHEAPSMEYGSNNCGFYIIKYLQAFEARRGLVDCVIDRVMYCLHC